MDHFEVRQHDKFVFGANCQWGRVAGWGVYSTESGIWVTVSRSYGDSKALADKLNEVIERKRREARGELDSR